VGLDPTVAAAESGSLPLRFELSDDVVHEDPKTLRILGIITACGSSGTT